MKGISIFLCKISHVELFNKPKAGKHVYSTGVFF